MKNFTIAIPVFNDWNNLNRLLKKINLMAKKNSFEFNILIINDFSTIKQKINFKKNIYIKKLDQKIKFFECKKMILGNGLLPPKKINIASKGLNKNYIWDFYSEGGTHNLFRKIK